MKKLLLLLITIFGFTVNAQSLLVEDCSLLTVGDVGIDLTGATEGQGGWKIFAPPGTSLSNMSVVDMSGEYGNGFQITGSTVSTSSTRYIYKNISEEWIGRLEGNNICEVTYDFYTGPVSTSKNTQRLAIYAPPVPPATSGLPLGGLLVVMDTKELKGIARYDNAGTVGNYVFGLGATAATPILLAPNTWYKLGFSFNKATGEVKWKCPQLDVNRFVIGAMIGKEVNDVQMLSTSILFTGETNTTSSVGVFDNINATATATDTLLATESVEITASNFETYPNPATSIVNISSKNNGINSVVMTDVNGRTVKNINIASTTETQINISDLAAGVYMMRITSNEGTATKKIIKE